MSGVLRACLCGDAAVGKSALAAALSSGKFTDSLPATETIFSTSIKVDGKLTVLEFADTMGADEYERTRVAAYPTSDMFILLFSIISPTSYESIRGKTFLPFFSINIGCEWASEIRRYAPNKPIVLVGTKADLRTDEDALERLAQRQLAPTSYEQGLKMAKEIGAVGYLETSAADFSTFSALLDEVANVMIPNGKRKSAKKPQKRARAKSLPGNNQAVSDKKTCTLV